MASVHRMAFGAEPQPGSGVRFALWAPRHEHIALELDPATSASETAATLPMQREGGGWHRLTTRQARPGSRYRFVLPDGSRVPDPASRHQPDDVHGSSEVIDPAAYAWQDGDWQGRDWNETVLYELHVGTFTPAGTFLSAMERLGHLTGLGVTALELLPVADFPGRRNWGYDGVLPFAPDSSYGRPEDLKALVDAAHAHGLMVFLDVVYNHFGPDGNYLGCYAPEFFSAQHRTPWGAAINFDAGDSPTVREFFIDNALYWLEEFHLDGLRLDAVHAIIDDSSRHILDALARRVRDTPWPRRVHLILENEHNQARWLPRTPDGGAELYDAQWNDDVHHVLHVAASGETEGYYAEYQHDTARVGRALAQGFAFQGELMRYRDSSRGEPCAHLPPTAFVAFIQNHDQIGNRALGERLTEIAAPEAVRAVTAVYLLLPQIPMLFMGEEWHSSRPFQFFCDFDGELAEAVRRGRRQEFARFAAFSTPAEQERIPDPQSDRTFLDSKLDWERLGDPVHAATLSWYRELLAIRRRHIVPLLPALKHGGQAEVIADGALIVRWRTAAGGELCLSANLSARAAAGFPAVPGGILWQEGQIDAGTYSAWALRWALRDAVGAAAGARGGAT